LLATEENYKKYIESWNKTALDFHPEHMSRNLICRVWYCEKCGNEVANSEDGKTHIGRIGYTDICEYCQHYLTDNRHFEIGYRKAKKVSITEFRFGWFSALSEDGYVAATNSFLQWAEAFTLETARKLTEAVKPEIYNQIAKLMIKPKNEAEK
jgi:hypothetical protein